MGRRLRVVRIGWSPTRLRSWRQGARSGRSRRVERPDALQRVKIGIQGRRRHVWRADAARRGRSEGRGTTTRSAATSDWRPGSRGRPRWRGRLFRRDVLRRRTRRIQRHVSHQRVEASGRYGARPASRSTAAGSRSVGIGWRERRGTAPIGWLQDDGRNDIPVAGGHDICGFETRPALRI